METTQTPIEWIPRGKNFESSECGKGRFDIMFVEEKGHWLAIDWDRAAMARLPERADCREWCELQLPLA